MNYVCEEGSVLLNFRSRIFLLTVVVDKLYLRKRILERTIISIIDIIRLQFTFALFIAPPCQARNKHRFIHNKNIRRRSTNFSTCHGAYPGGFREKFQITANTIPLMACPRERAFLKCFPVYTNAKSQ